MKYQQFKMPTAADFQNFRNLSAGERQARFQQYGTAGMNGIKGEIISKDADSITVKLPGGGSKIVFYSDSTEIGKSASGTSVDLEIGKTVIVNGAAHSGGNFAAKSI